MKIYLATWFEEPAQADALTNKGYLSRLLSYFHTKEKEDKLKRYVCTGLIVK